MYVSQVLMASLPNIEIVSLLIIIITRKFGVRSFYSVYIFVALEILTYGLHIWVINYLYIWAILCLAVLLIRKTDNTFIYAGVSALFGFLFGTFCSIPYFITGGFSFGISYIISGLYFDLLHGIGNAVTATVLYRPITKVLNKIPL